MTPAELRKATAAWRRAEQREAALRVERDRLIALALADGMTHARISEATGLTRGRIGQMAKGR